MLKSVIQSVQGVKLTEQYREKFILFERKIYNILYNIAGPPYYARISLHGDVSSSDWSTLEPQLPHDTTSTSLWQRQRAN